MTLFCNLFIERPSYIYTYCCETIHIEYHNILWTVISIPYQNWNPDIESSVGCTFKTSDSKTKKMVSIRWHVHEMTRRWDGQLATG